MKALILSGGYGTRLRPLTLTKPKPLVDFCNKPILCHQIEALAKAGVKTIILAVSYLSDALSSKAKDFETEYSVKIIISQETEPLGTAGPLAFAKHLLDDSSENPQPFFVLNSDISCRYPFTEMIQFHTQKKAKATIAVTQVEDPSKYGVLVIDDDSKVHRFVEKPKTFVSNLINAGIYLLDPSIIDFIEPRQMSIEKEVFPIVAEGGMLYAFRMEGFWMDIGQPKDYLIGMKLYLNDLKCTNPNLLYKNPNGSIQTAIIHPEAVIGSDCYIGPCVVIGKNVIVKNGVYLSDCVLMERVVVNDNSYISKSIIGWGCQLGRWARVENHCIFGENVSVADEVFLNSVVVLPQKSISESIFENEVVV